MRGDVGRRALRQNGSRWQLPPRRRADPRQKPLPVPKSGFYQLAETLKADDPAAVKQARALVAGSCALWDIEG